MYVNYDTTRTIPKTRPKKPPLLSSVHCEIADEKLTWQNKHKI